MWKGLDTMVIENTKEEVTVSDGLQLGRNIEQSDMQADDELPTGPTAEVGYKSTYYDVYMCTCNSPAGVVTAPICSMLNYLTIINSNSIWKLAITGIYSDS